MVLLFLLSLGALLLMVALLFNLPLLLLVWLLRRRLNPLVACALVGCGFSAAAAYQLWRMDWFDVWRHGVPGPSILLGYLPWMLAIGLCGWLTAAPLVNWAPPANRG